MIEKAFAEIKRISEKYSFEKKNSYLSALNRGESSLDAETEFLLRFASKLYRESSGAFDPTVGRLKLLWGFNEKPSLPSGEEIRRALKWVGMDKLRIENKKITSKGVLLDFSAFAKGYAVDRACEILERGGVTSALIDAGGDIRVLNSKADGSPWEIGIKNPVGDGIIKVIELKNSAVATSGDYENYFVKDGKRYHHLLNPKTGYPARGLHSVSVIAPTAMQADAYATAVFVLGWKEGLELARKLGVRAIAVDKKGKIWDSASQD